MRVIAFAALGASCQQGTTGDVRVLDTPDGAITDLGANDVVVREDDAEIVRATWPARLRCGETATATVVVRNTGASTWTRLAGYTLGAAGDSDPLGPGDVRSLIRDGDTVPPGATHAFDLALVGAATPGVYTSRWQMSRMRVRHFGAVATRDIAVDCPATPDAAVVDVPTAVDAHPPTDVPAVVDVPAAADVPTVTSIDLASATVLNSPADVASWPATARITRLDLGADGVRIDFTRRDGPDSWPDVPFITPGEDLQYTLWIVLHVGGRWYTSGCIQYWRGLDRNGGPPSGYAMNWYYDPNRWAPMTGHQPAVGESVGFFVTAGNARNVTDHSGSVVRERSDVVVVPFPADPGRVYTF